MANRKKRLERERLRHEREQQLKIALQRHKQQEDKNIVIAEVMKHWNGDKRNKRWRKAKADFKLYKYLKQHVIEMVERLLTTHPDRAKVFEQALLHRKLRFVETSFLIALLQALVNTGKIFRDLTCWKPTKSSNEELIFQDLFEHVFVGYKINKSILKLLTIRNMGESPNWNVNKLILDVAAGKGIHKVEYLNGSVSKKMNFFFENAPEKFKTFQAMAWAKVKAMGASDKLAYILAGNYRSEYDWEWDGWRDDFVFFAIKEKLEDTKLLKSIVEFYLYQSGIRTKMVKIKDAELEVPVLFSDFKFKGRTLTSVVRMKEEWEKHVQEIEKNGAFPDFQPSGIEGYRLETRNGNLIQIKELKNPIELVREGSAMKHCVATYTGACTEGRSSIWSMKMLPKTTGKAKRLITIEIEKNENEIDFGEVQGKANTCPPQYAIDVMKKWGMEIGVPKANEWQYDE